MIRFHFAFAILSVFCCGAVAQQNAPAATPPTHQHHIIDAPMISGKDHPEQIPDHAAYGLFLAAISRPSMPTDEEKKSQAVHLKMMRLSDSDTQAAIAILASFNERRKALIDAYNAKAEAANTQGQAVDPAIQQSFFADLASLIDTTHDDLKSTLSAQGWALWDAHVQDEKRKMTIPTSEGVQ
jgi:hypothetical protein